jgi:mannose-6-phosphate isomerase-like protein (cupin superfamily)
MKHIKTNGHRRLFDVLLSSRSAQAAMMTLRKGQCSSDEPENEHPRSEQWLFVVSGAGVAIVSKAHVKLSANSLLLIEKGEPHQIRQTGAKPLVTLNFYSPPAYTPDGELKPAAK